MDLYYVTRSDRGSVKSIGRESSTPDTSLPYTSRITPVIVTTTQSNSLLLDQLEQLFALQHCELLTDPELDWLHALKRIRAPSAIIPNRVIFIHDRPCKAVSFAKVPSRLRSTGTLRHRGEAVPSPYLRTSPLSYDASPCVEYLAFNLEGRLTKPPTAGISGPSPRP